jgi:RimJ/RimL family protein N-acetyltransferase
VDEIQLETDRLLLRMWREETDFETYAAMCADEDVMRYIGGKTMTRVLRSLGSGRKSNW